MKKSRTEKFSSRCHNVNTVILIGVLVCAFLGMAFDFVALLWVCLAALGCLMISVIVTDSYELSMYKKDSLAIRNCTVKTLRTAYEEIEKNGEVAFGSRDHARLLADQIKKIERHIQDHQD